MPIDSKVLALAACLAMVACTAPDEQADGQGTATTTPAATASASTPTECTSGAGTVLTGAGVAGIRMREDAEEVRRRCNVVADTTLILEGQPQPAMKIALNGDTIIAEIVDDRIWRINITSPGLATSDSLRVGTPARRLAAIPGAIVTPGEGNYYVLLPDHCGLSFALDGLPIRARPWTIAELATQPDSARVTKILITGSCHENGNTRILWDTTQ